LKRLTSHVTHHLRELWLLRKKVIDSKDLAAVGISVDSAWSLVVDSFLRPPRAAGIKVIDDNAAEQMVSFLVEKKLI